MCRYYILDEQHCVIEVTLEEWGDWFSQTNKRRVGYTQINSKIEVSTVFIGLDHRFIGKGPPLLFETMIFGGSLDGDTWRYSSWDDAETGHKATVSKAREAAGQKVSSD